MPRIGGVDGAEQCVKNWKGEMAARLVVFVCLDERRSRLIAGAFPDACMPRVVGVAEFLALLDAGTVGGAVIDTPCATPALRLRLARLERDGTRWPAVVVLPDRETAPVVAGMAASALHEGECRSRAWQTLRHAIV